jgi:tripartite-type tricarboxylate transporter receptor subunit TctC
MRLQPILVVFGLVTFGLTMAANPVRAQVTYPTGVVKIIVPYVPGGAADVSARILREFLAERWGQSIVVENRPGGATVTATTMVASAPPDGLTMLLTTTPFLVNPTLQGKLPYDTLRDFAGVSMVVAQSVALVVHPSVKANTVAEFVAEAKRRTEPFNFGSSGVGGISHLTGELFAQTAGIKLSHIPYRGSGAALVDLLSGQIPVLFDAGYSAKSHVDAGKLKVLAFSSKERPASLPNIPTFAETYPGFDARSISALVVPSATPKNIIAKMSADIQAIVRSPAYAAKVTVLGFDAVASTPEELDDFNRREMEKWAEVIKAAHIKPN